jgi:hypothetical protein
MKLSHFLLQPVSDTWRYIAVILCFLGFLLIPFVVNGCALNNIMFTRYVHPHQANGMPGWAATMATAYEFANPNDTMSTCAMASAVLLADCCGDEKWKCWVGIDYPTAKYFLNIFADYSEINNDQFTYANIKEMLHMGVFFVVWRYHGKDFPVIVYGVHDYDETLYYVDSSVSDTELLNLETITLQEFKKVLIYGGLVQPKREVEKFYPEDAINVK